MKLSVAMITYNHEKFIAQAIEGVLMQETDFDFELVIGEDCSTDGTAAIVADYQRRYPDKIKAIIREKNTGGSQNFREVEQTCIGEYIALCEGDDYWTDPRKLQKQVDLLDANPGCAECFHRVRHVDESGSELTLDPSPSSWKEVSYLEDMLVEGGIFIPTPSTVYRNGLIRDYPKWRSELPFGDWLHHILVAQHGDVRFINEIMASYRHHSGGAWTGRDTEVFWRGELRMYDGLDEHFAGKYRSLTRLPICKRCYMLALSHEKRGERKEALRYAWRRLRTLPFDRSCEQPLKHITRLLLPGVYGAMKSAKGLLRPQRTGDADHE